MSLQDVPVKNEYRSLIDNVVQDFYLPLLKEATVYKRAVGFFSSSSLVEISKGIAKMASSGGKIQIVASPYLCGLFRTFQENSRLKDPSFTTPCTKEKVISLHTLC